MQSFPLTGEHESSDVTPVQPMAGPQHPLQQPIIQAQPAKQRLSYPRMVATISLQRQQSGIHSNPGQHESTLGLAASSNSVGNSPTNIPGPSSTIPVLQNRYAQVRQTSNAVSATSLLTRQGPDAIVPSIAPKCISNIQDTVMTCSQFHEFLERILQNEQEYSQAMNKVYTVGPMQQVGPKVYFNIEKASKRHKQWHDSSSSTISLSSGSENKVTKIFFCFIQRTFTYGLIPIFLFLCQHSNTNM